MQSLLVLVALVVGETGLVVGETGLVETVSVRPGAISLTLLKALKPNSFLFKINSHP